MKPHKHAELIKAWADGFEIQFYSSGGSWIYDPDPSWNCENMIFRIKPEEKKPVVRWLWADEHGFVISQMQSEEEVRHGLIRIEGTRTEFPK